MEIGKSYAPLPKTLERTGILGLCNNLFTGQKSIIYRLPGQTSPKYNFEEQSI